MPAEENKAIARRTYELLAARDLEGLRKMTRYTWSGTHRGEMAGIAPTGKRVEVGGIEIYRIKGGKVTDVWRIEETLSLMQQLGMVPELGES
jgi:predicted ester cyclase